MKFRFGAILCVILGVVLLQSGLSSGSSSTVGGVTVDPCPVTDVPQIAPAAAADDLASGFCPIGTIAVTEQTQTNDNPDATAPATWSVTLSSTNCQLPDGLDATKDVDNNGGETTWDGLFVYTNDDRVTQCSYALSVATVSPFTATFTPDQPYTFLDGVNQAIQPAVATTSQSVLLKNVAPPVTPPKSSSSAAPTSASATVPSTAPSFTSSSSGAVAPILATTGPHSQVRGSLIGGIALCVLGGVLLFAGRRPRTARHR